MLERPTRRGKPAAPSTRRKRRRELARARHDRHKQRVAAGRIVVPVEVGADELTWLIRVRWLMEAEADAGDPRIIGEAIAHGLAASAKG